MGCFNSPSSFVVVGKKQIRTYLSIYFLYLSAEEWRLDANVMEQNTRHLRCGVLLPFSLSDLFSCSVSVRVSTELDRLDRQELLSDVFPRSPWHQSRLLFAGDVAA